jgi:hypothetical protein
MSARHLCEQPRHGDGAPGMDKQTVVVVDVGRDVRRIREKRPATSTPAQRDYVVIYQQPKRPRCPLILPPMKTAGPRRRKRPASPSASPRADLAPPLALFAHPGAACSQTSIRRPPDSPPPLDSDRTISHRTDVASWLDQRRSSRRGSPGRAATRPQRHGQIDFVAVDAGIGDRGHACAYFGADAEPQPPNLKCLEVHIHGIFYGRKPLLHYVLSKPNMVWCSRLTFQSC